MAELWSDGAEFVIGGMEKQIKSDYEISFRELLTDPSQFVKEEAIQVKISNIREEVNKYVGNIMKGLGEEQKKLEDMASRANSITAQLSQSLSSLSKQYKLPIIKPVAVERGSASDTTIYVGSASLDVTQLMEKLMGVSDYIVDLSAKYKDSNIGKWLFSGKNATIINVDFGPSPALEMYNTMNEIDSMLDATSTIIKGIVGK